MSLEYIVQRDSIKLLRDNGVYVARVNNVKISGAGQFVRLPDIDKGVPDVLACINGEFHAFEFKSDKGKLSQFQKAQKKNIEKNNGNFHEIHSYQEMKDLWELNLKRKHQIALDANFVSKKQLELI